MATLLSLRDTASHHLTHADDTLKKLDETHIGMAHFAGTGPSGEFCRNCKNWQSEGYSSLTSSRHGELKDSRCAVYTRLMQKQGRKVPHFASACRHFDGSGVEYRPVRDPKAS